MSTPYTGLTESELVALRADYLARLQASATGGDFQSVTVGGKSFTRHVATLDQLRDELFWVNAALQEINPTTYGRRITCTAARFV